MSRQKRLLPASCLFLAFLAMAETAPFAASPVSVAHINYFSKSLYTRLVIDFSGAVSRPKDYNEIFEYSRFYVDVPSINQGTEDRVISIQDDLVDRVETRYYPQQKAQRFLFYLKKKAPYEINVFNDPSPRLVIDILRNGSVVTPSPEGVAAKKSAISSSAGAAASASPAKAKAGESKPPAAGASASKMETRLPAPKAEAPVTASLTPLESMGRRKKIIIIDPGHGGKSWGAVSAKLPGLGYLNEKDIVMKVSLELEKLIKQSSNMTPSLTRRDDTYISLNERCEFSKQHNGDLFISIHCNAAGLGEPSAHGVEFYYLNPKGESSTAHHMLEDLENDRGIVDVKKTPGAGDLANILKGLTESRMAEYASESRRFTDVMNRQFQTASYPGFTKYNRGPKSANFNVLRQATPRAAMLLEIGYLSQAEEARHLADDAFQKMVARLVFNALNDYFADRDPDFKPTRVALK
ncbi:MAG: N-acetylmuramoyl-L-alanine amidase [Candidatus Sumerlaeota bacterium]|nr:N-acetylmuramoyl-L-alanine amidase [Candidatus Sumerlaeota bacterium]